MNLLIVDDEPGIREGLATFLRMRGHVVRTAGSRHEGLAELRGDSAGVDAVISDWNLGDGDATALIDALPDDVPCFVVSGYPESVTLARPRLHVIAKPVSPLRLVELLDREAPQQSVAAAPRATAPAVLLPQDTRDRIELVRASIGAAASATLEVFDDGEFVTLRFDRPADATLPLLERVCGGDLRALRRPSGAAGLELRLHRDSRPAGVRVVSWRSLLAAPDRSVAIDDAGVAYDLAAEPCSPSEFLVLIDRLRAHRRARPDHAVHLLNVPSHLRLLADAFGRGADLPKREPAGPRLPEVLAELWS